MAETHDLRDVYGDAGIPFRLNVVGRRDRIDHAMQEILAVLLAIFSAAVAVAYPIMRSDDGVFELATVEIASVLGALAGCSILYRFVRDRPMRNWVDGLNAFLENQLTRDVRMEERSVRLERYIKMMMERMAERDARMEAFMETMTGRV